MISTLRCNSAVQIARRLPQNPIVFAAVIALAGFIGLMPSNHAVAQAVAAKSAIEDTWQGTLHIPDHDLRIVLKVSKDDKGNLKALNYSIDQGGQGIPVSAITFQDGELKFSIDVYKRQVTFTVQVALLL